MAGAAAATAAMEEMAETLRRARKTGAWSLRCRSIRSRPIIWCATA
ncbi:hypothetical protein ACFSHQ_27900 [Gemmobacter lanyuensis]